MKKKAIGVLLAATMLLATPCGAFADTSTSWETVPKVSLQANNISGADHDTLEFSIVVNNSNFKALGAAFEYDAGKLELIDWTTTESAVQLDGATSWQTAAIVESKCPDRISGKPAFAYKNGNTGYLYMGAESAAAQEIGDPTQVVTVRFGYVGGTTLGGIDADSIKFASGEAAYKSPVKGSMIYQTEDRASGNTKFFYLNPLKESTGGGYEEDTDLSGSGAIGGETGGGSTPSPIDPQPGDTVNTGTADANDFVSIVFYDWNGDLIGSRIINKGGSLIDPNTAENKTNHPEYLTMSDAELASAGIAPVVTEGGFFYDKGGAPIQNNAGANVVNKAGYTFAGWVDFNTGYSTPNIANSAAAGATHSSEELVPLTNISNNLILQAAYDENAGVIGSSGMRRYYEINYSNFVSQNGGLETTFTVIRNAASRRVIGGEAFLKLTITPNGAGNTILKIPLGSNDVEQYVLQMPSGADKNYNAKAISYTLSDRDDAARASASTSVPASAIVAH